MTRPRNTKFFQKQLELAKKSVINANFPRCFVNVRTSTARCDYGPSVVKTPARQRGATVNPKVGGNTFDGNNERLPAQVMELSGPISSPAHGP
jgi:hypothetical protein